MYKQLLQKCWFRFRFSFSYIFAALTKAMLFGLALVRAAFFVIVCFSRLLLSLAEKLCA